MAHEAGKNSHIRAVLGNDIAVKAFRESTLPFPDGTVIAGLAYVYKSSPGIDAVFPADQGTSCSAVTSYSDSIDRIIQWRQQ